MEMDIEIDMDNIKGLERNRSKLDINGYSRVIEAAYANSRTRYSLQEVTDIISYFFEEYKNVTGENHPVLSVNTLTSIISRLEYITDPDGIIIDLFPEDYPILIDKYFHTKFKKCDYRLSHFMSGNIRYYRYLETLY